MRKEIWKQLEEADFLLIGLGEEFDGLKILKKQENYPRVREKLEKVGREWMFPTYCDMLRERGEDPIRPCLEGLAGAVKDKDYFVVSTSTNKAISETAWKENRLVVPCGGQRKQCPQCCEEGLGDLSADEEEALRRYLLLVEQGQAGDGEESDILGRCPKCGQKLILNNIYTQYYDEKGYLPSWEKYTGWLQRTLNRKLFILELGVGMQCPTVIRFPFEKAAFYNRKAYLCRVNETLYQLPENLIGKGCSISENSVDWLRFLC